ncbi:RNA polymerase factor sigma-54 [Salirhabdus salicampi]|uniref:RNA polymerase factor sigma-54 n=1 Tax=Salirhabdus salicampi TaxID=476102 RepID=UPI0020C43639|nr:RNA polymerase factor sigma-54 [Salirhabdus salicampi]MCP8615947.1 RNA polymerase factor sigma-54 [Salirhabdus salicampi]
MKLSLTKEQKMGLNMTPEMKQGLSILQYSSIELASFIQNESLENPFIEIEETTYPDYFSDVRRRPTARTNDSSTTSPLEFISDERNTLYNDLLEQLTFLRLTNKEKFIVHYIITTLNESGYYEEEVRETAQHLGVTEFEVKSALHLVQGLEPVGVGATSLQQCLLLQLEHYYPQNEIAKKVVADHLEDLSLSKWGAIATKLDIDETEIRNILTIIQSLNPKPGSQFNSTSKTNYIIPDLYIRVENGNVTVEINDRSLPKISLSSDYETMLHNVTDNKANQFLKDKYKKFLWLRKNIEQRSAILLNVTKAIVHHQLDFFLKGNASLRPLTLKDIAEQCDVHISTISRATKHKYVQTPFGVYPLKHFFPSAISLNNGNITSSHNIKQMMKELIKSEDPAKPLSDQQLANHINSKNIIISRRTVAKYREQLNIPSSTNRKYKEKRKK